MYTNLNVRLFDLKYRYFIYKDFHFDCFEVLSVITICVLLSNESLHPTEKFSLFANKIEFEEWNET